MAVTRVMLVEADRQLFAVPMDEVVETVRVPRSQIHALKQHQTTLLRSRIVPLAPGASAFSVNCRGLLTRMMSVQFWSCVWGIMCWVWWWMIFTVLKILFKNPSPVFWLICAAFRAPLCWGWLGTDGFKY